MFVIFVTEPKFDNIYYHREVVCYSLEGRRIDLITISSHHNITSMREPRLANLFPDSNVPRPFQYLDKKVGLLAFFLIRQFATYNI